MGPDGNSVEIERAARDQQKTSVICCAGRFYAAAGGAGGRAEKDGNIEKDRIRETQRGLEINALNFDILDETIRGAFHHEYSAAVPLI